MEGAESGGVLGGEGVDDGAGLVGGAVVDGEDLEVGVVLVEEGVEGGGDVGGFVAGGDDDGDGGIVRRREVVLRDEEIGDAGEADGLAVMAFQSQARAMSQADEFELMFEDRGACGYDRYFVTAGAGRSGSRRRR